MRRICLLIGLAIGAGGCGAPPPAAERAGSPAVSAPFDVAAVVRRVSLAYRADGAEFTGGHATYSVRVNAAGDVSLAPRAAEAEAEGGTPSAAAASTTGTFPPGPAPLEIHTVAVTRGDVVLAEGSAGTWLDEDGSLSVLRGGVLERLANAEDGVEQSWTFLEEPAGAGPVLVRVAAGGQAYAGATERGLHFADEATGLGFRYGVATWIDGTGASTGVPVRFEGGELVLEVPADVVERSAFPAVLDPVISPELGLDAPIREKAGDQSRPAVSYAGGSYLVVWEDYVAGARDVLGARVSRDGALLDPAGIRVGARADADTWPTTASNGSVHVVAWISGTQLYTARVSPLGVPSAHVRIPSAYPQAHGGIASDGDGFLVTWTEYRPTSWELWCARLSTTGALSGEPLLVAGEPARAVTPQVAFGGEAYLVAWHDTRSGGYDVRAARIDRAGVVLDPGGFPVSAGSASESEPAVAAAQDGWRVVWHDKRNGNSDVYGARIAWDGAVLDPDGVPLAATSALEYRPAIAWTGGQHLVAWIQSDSGDTQVDRDVRATRLDASLTATDAPPIPVAVGAGLQYSPAVAWDGDEFLVAWQDDSGGADVLARRIDMGATTLGDPTVVTSQKANAQQQPVVAFGADRYLVAWLDDRVASGIVAARVTAAGEVLDPAGLVLTASGSTFERPAVAFDGASFVVAWIDGVMGEVRASRVSSAGGLLDPGGVVLSSGARARKSLTLASSGSGVLAAWQTDSLYVEGALLSPTGAASPVLQITSPYGVTPERLPVAAFGGGVYVVVWDGYVEGVGSGLAVTRVSTTGSILDPKGRLLGWASVSSRPAVVFDGTSFVVVWEKADDLYAARFSSSGATVETVPLRLTETPHAERAVAAAFDGQDTIVVWEDARAGADVFGLRVSPAGAVVGSEFAVAALASLERSPSIASDGAGHGLVVYQRPDAELDAQLRVKARAFTTRVGIAVTRAGAGRGSVTSEPPAIACGDLCSATLEAGEPIVLVAVPDSTSVFTGWAGDCTGTGPCTVVADRPLAVTATFAPAGPALTVRRLGTGAGTVTSSPAGIECGVACSATFPAGTLVTLTAAEAPGSIFTSWSGCTSASGSTCTVGLAAARNVYATFQPSAWTLTARTAGLGKGSVTGEGITCASGSTAGCTASVPNTSPATAVTLTAQEDASSIFVGWSGCNAVSGRVCTVSMTGARSATATFAPSTYPLTVRTSGLGKGSVGADGIACASGSTTGCTATVPNTTPATAVTLTAQEDPSSIFVSWSGCTSVSGRTCTVAMASARYVTATFAPATFLLTVRTSGLGKGSVAGDGIACASGSTAGCTATVPNTTPATAVTLTAQEDASSIFVSWSGCTSVSGRSCTVAMASVRSVTATFAPSTFPLTVRTSGQGKGTVAGDGIACSSGSTAGCSATVPNTTPATVVTLTAQEDASSLFVSWSGCNAVSGRVCTVSMIGARSATATFAPSTYPLTVRTSGVGKGTVTGDAIACASGSTAGCTAVVPNTTPATTVTLTASEDASSLFVSWSGCNAVSGRVCTVSMIGARSATATFAPSTFPLTVRTSGQGKGTVAGDGIACSSGSTAGCSATVPNTTPATVVTLTAQEDASSLFVSWSGCNAVSGRVCTVSMIGARSATATFAPSTFPLTVRTSGQGKGTVAGDGIACSSGSTAGCSATVPNTTPATVVTLTAQEDASSTFVSWSGCTSVSGRACTVSMSAARTVTASFAPSTYTLMVRTSGLGKGTVSGDAIACASGSTAGCTAIVPNTTPATSVTLTAQEDGSSIFVSWTGCTSVSGRACTVSMGAARSVTASFAPSTYTLTVRTSGLGKGTVTGDGIACAFGSTAGCTAIVPNTTPATEVVLVAEPAPGSVLAFWSGCARVDGLGCAVSMGGARSVTASFGVATASP